MNQNKLKFPLTVQSFDELQSYYYSQLGYAQPVVQTTAEATNDASTAGLDFQKLSIDQIFEKCMTVTMSKRHDYTSGTDAHENFKHSTELISWFYNDNDTAYVALIATKLTRLASLLNENKTPNNESIQDTFIDLINYCALWAERRLNTNGTKS